MATGTTGVPSPAAPLVGKSNGASKNTATNDRENYILRQIQSTRNQVKNLELGQSFLLLVVGVLAFFLSVAVIDHWVVSGGLSKWQRGACFIFLLGGVGWYLWKKFLPLFMMRINPFYAAKTLEQSAPTMKNGLINYLWFRQSRAEMPETIYNVIQEQTARGLTSVQIDQAIDRTPLIRIMYVLLACVFTFSLYFLISPKNPFTTIFRVVSPWSDVQSPSRVQITNIEPGTTKIYRGQSLVIKCEIANLRSDEAVVLHYTTHDGQLRDIPVTMKLPTKGYRYECTLPAPMENSSNANSSTGNSTNVVSGGANDSTNNASQPVAGNSVATVNPMAVDPMRNPMLGGIPGMTDAELQHKLGLQQDFEYWITAGDAKTGNFRVQVESAPFIAVERIDFDYPAYTNMARETRNDPDINVIEGTRVTIHALANQPMKSGSVELFTKTGRIREPMKINGVNGTASFTLNFKDDQQVDQEYTGYQLRFTNNEKRENPEPIRHSIKIFPDISPSVEIIEPASTDKALAPNQPFHVNVTATDPDHGLTQVRLIGEFQGEPLFTQNLLVASTENPHVGKFQRSVDLSLDQLGLKPGMSIEYWAEATDVKSPHPNVVQTNKRRLTILNPDQDREQQARDKQQQNPQGGNPQQNPGENGQNDQNNQQANNEQNSDNQNPDKQNAARNNPNPQAQPPKNAEGQKGANPENRGGNPPENNNESRDPTKNDGGKQGDNNRRQENTLNQKGGNQNLDPKENSGKESTQENKTQQNDATQNRGGDNQTNRDGSKQENRDGTKNGTDNESGKQNSNPMNGQRDSQGQSAQNQNPQGQNDRTDNTGSKSGNEGQKSDSNTNDPSRSNQNTNPQQSKSGQQSPNNKSAGRPAEAEKKVNPDGSQDDKAIKKLLDDIEKKFGKKPEQKNSDGSDPNDPNNKDPQNPSEQQLAQNDKDKQSKSGQGSKQSDAMKFDQGKNSKAGKKNEQDQLADARNEQKGKGGKQPEQKSGDGSKETGTKNERTKDGENKKGSNPDQKDKDSQGDKDQQRSGEEKKNDKNGKQQNNKKDGGKSGDQDDQTPGKEQGKQKSGEKGSDKNNDGKQGNDQRDQGQKSSDKQNSTQQKSGQKKADPQSGQTGQEQSKDQNSGDMNPSENQPENKSGQSGQDKQSQQQQNQQSNPQQQNQQNSQFNPMSQSGNPSEGQQGNPSQGQQGDSKQQQENPSQQGNQSNQAQQGNSGKEGQSPQQSGQQPGKTGEGQSPNGKSQQQDGTGTKGSSTSQSNNAQNEQSGKSGSPSAQQNRSTSEEKGKAAQAGDGGQQRTDSNKQSNSKSQPNNSQTQGESQGDRAGAGEPGQGNPSKSEGKGSAGSSTPDDSGANSVNQQGMGETGTQAGDQVKSDSKTGRAGNEAGKGSSSRTTQQQTGTEPGQGSAGKGTEKGTGEQTAQNDPNAQSGEPGSSTGQGQPDGNPANQNNKQPANPNTKSGKAGNGTEGNFGGTGGKGTNGAHELPPAQGAMPPAPEEKVNEEYAKKATDLVLEHLKNQLRDGKVDQDALNQLGWTEAELKQFVARWEQLRAEAQKPGPEGELAAKKLNDRLKSLGLRPTQTTRANSTAGDDNQRGNTESRRTPPPAEFRQMFNDFKKATSGK